MSILINWVLSALAILVTAYLLPQVTLSTFFTAFVVAVVIGLINITIRPILLLFTLPINMITLGLFTFFLNAFLILLTSYLTPGFTITSFWWAVVFSIVLSLVHWVLKRFAKSL